MKQKDLTEDYRLFIQYVIVGFQDGSPRVYTVQFYIDWRNKKLVGPSRTLLTQDSGILGFYGFGIRESFMDFMNPQSYAYKQALVLSPKALGDWLAPRDIPINETIDLTRILIGVEEKTNPSAVAGKVQIIKVLPNGRADRVIN